AQELANMSRLIKDTSEAQDKKLEDIKRSTFAVENRLTEISERLNHVEALPTFLGEANQEQQENPAATRELRVETADSEQFPDVFAACAVTCSATCAGADAVQLKVPAEKTRRSSFDSLDTGVTGEVGQVQEEVWLLHPASWVGGASTANGSTPQEVVFEPLTGEDKELRNKVALRIACQGNCDQAGSPSPLRGRLLLRSMKEVIQSFLDQDAGNGQLKCTGS
ncbi:unnamed protein product, partial [Gadus morhua 'NCC']